MKCPFCSHPNTNVIDSREQDDGGVIRRRRRCQSCDRRFTTFERLEMTMPMVVKRNGMRMDFDPAKVEASMSMALRKRPVTAEQREQALARIMETLFNQGQKEVTSDAIGELVMSELKQLDQVAYVRFASVYQSFEHIDEFVKTISEIRKN